MRFSRWLTLPLSVATLTYLGASDSDAQGVPECFDSTAPGGGGYKVVVPSSTVSPGPNQIRRNECDGSVNRVFRNQTALVTQTLAQKIQTAVTNCVLPNGPYRRIDLVGGDPRFDYVTIVANAPNAGPTGVSTGSQGRPSINDQIGIDPGFQMSATLAGMASGTGTSSTVTDTTSGFPNGATATQIMDAPGFDWIMLLKDTGNVANQNATLICDENMWFTTVNGDPSSGQFGIKNFVTSFNVNSIIIAWAAGPSGFGTQAAINSACAAQNPVLTITDPDPDSGEPGANLNSSREAFLPMMLGFYKTLPGDPNPPVNGTACSSNSADYARYCDQGELPGSLNSCNPDGGVGNTISSVAIGVQGEGTLCLSTSSTGSLRLRC